MILQSLMLPIESHYIDDVLYCFFCIFIILTCFCECLVLMGVGIVVLTCGYNLVES